MTTAAMLKQLQRLEAMTPVAFHEAMTLKEIARRLCFNTHKDYPDPVVRERALSAMAPWPDLTVAVLRAHDGPERTMFQRHCTSLPISTVTEPDCDADGYYR